MEIRLADQIRKMPELHIDYLADRKRAKELFEKCIADQLLNCRDSVRKVILNCYGIQSASSSFIDELLFINIFTLNYKHGNSVLLLTNLTDEFYFNIRLAVEGKKNLIEEAKKNSRYFLTTDLFKKEYAEGLSDNGSCQIGSPYLLCEYKEKIEVLGFAEGEKQKKLLEYIVQEGRRITSSQLSDQENITKTAANNRLNRLFEKNLIFRELIAENLPEKYEYFYDIK